MLPFPMILIDSEAIFQGFNNGHSRAASLRQLSFLSNCKLIICVTWIRREDVKLSKEFPNIAPRDTPTVALITSRFCEKVAVDAMLESKVTYIKHDPDGSTPGKCPANSRVFIARQRY